jgi:hypothetical protein
LRENARFVFEHPEQLGRGEAGHRDVASDRTRGRRSCLEFRAMLLASPIVPQDPGSQWLIILPEQRGAVHLARKSDALHFPAQISVQ